MLISFTILTALFLIAAIDDSLSHKPELGEEWDFTRSCFKPKSIDTNK